MSLAAWFLLAAAAPTDCASAFEAVASGVEDDYAGYVVKLADNEARANHRRFRELLRARAASAGDHASCRDVLETYVGFFADHHLFVASRGQETSPLPAPARRWTPAAVEKYFKTRAGHLDRVEGHWYDAEGRIAVLRDDGLPAGQYLALRLAEDGGTTPLARIERAHGDYRITYRHAQWGWQASDAALVRDGRLLAFGVLAWGRPGDESLDAADPQAPTFRTLAPGRHLLSLPSFMPQYRPVLNQIISEHGAQMAAADALVVDVRGNAGGDAIYFPLAPYFLANAIRISDDTSLRASPRTVAWFEQLRAQQGEHGAWLDGPLQAMRQAEPGAIIPYREGSVDGLAEYPEKPGQVLVLQDRGVGSAAEAFIYHARQSAKVVTIGEPTRGNIDYMQVSMREVGDGRFGYWFGWPMYFNRALPAASVDDEGYAPDVRIDADALAFAQAWLDAAP